MSAVTAERRLRTVRGSLARRVSPCAFALAAVAFILPFGTVSCDGETTTFTGVQLVVHAVPETRPQYVDTDARPLHEQVEEQGSLFAGAGLAAALAGIGLGVAARRGAGWCAGAGLLSLLILLWQAATSLAEVNLHSGYLLALVTFTYLSAHHAVAATRRARRRRS